MGMGKRRVAVTGLGVIAANGIGVRDFWEANIRGRSGVSALTAFDTAHCETTIAAQIKNFDPRTFMPDKIAKRVDRFVHFALAAASLAVEDSRLQLADEDRSRIGVIMGTGLGGVLFHEEQLLAAVRNNTHRFNPLSVSIVSPNAVSAHLAIRYQLTGPNYVITTACVSGNHALGEALRKIQHGEADIVFSGGVEAPLTEFVFGAFQAMKVLSKHNAAPEQASRPFDKNRDGFVMGEGGAVLILEELNHARERNAPIYAEVAGYGTTNGAYHMVMPKPEGDDAASAMQLALKDAQVVPKDIHYINAHGTGTQANDVCETKAIKRVFSDAGARIPISSTKSMIGHALGAAPALEAAVSCLAIKHQSLPPTINYSDPDPECDLDYIPNRARQARVDTVLSNAFGFGSANASLVFKKLL